MILASWRVAAEMQGRRIRLPMNPRLSRLTPAPLGLCARYLLLLLLVVLAPAARAQMHNGIELVKADLIADTAAIVPGKPFTVGLRLKMAPRWHTYWQNPGDAGLATTIAWQLPDGFQASPIRWPLPERIESPGDILNYGYGDEIVLLTEITPPAQISAREITLKAKTDWLTCAEICVPGNATLQLSLPVSSPSATQPAAANADLIASYRARLPRPDGLITVAREVKGSELQFTFKTAAPDGGADKNVRFEFYPTPPPTMEVGAAKATDVVVGGDATVTGKIALPLLTNPGNADEIGGVLVVSSADGVRTGYLVPAAKSSAAAAPSPAASSVPVTGNRAATLGTVPPASNPATPAGSLWRFLLLGLIGGLVLNVMPCVLPVISLKIFGFIQQANEKPERIWRLGLAYVAGIFAWFLGFALLVIAFKAAGREVGYSFQFQNAWFVVAMCAVVFVFALNLLGVFEVVLPGSVNDAAAGATTREGYGGAFFQGLLATVLASACTAPFFGTALGFAFSQNAAVILAMFAAISLGMGLPFLLLTRFPAWLRYLPRPGAWMERVKQVTGFLLLATVIWLLSIVGALRGADGVVWTGAFLLALGVACWVQGAFNTFSAAPRGRWIARAVIVALVVIGGAWTLREVARSERGGGIAENGGARAPFSSQLAAALTQNRIVFVDFTAAWCVNCKVNEKTVLATEPVQRALREKNAIFLTADWTDGAEDITRLLKGFGRAGVPLYVVYPAGKTTDPIVLPELLTQRIVLDALDEADRRAGTTAKPLAAASGN